MLARVVIMKLFPSAEIDLFADNNNLRAEKRELGGAVRETKFSDGKCWLGRRNRSWAAYRRYMGGAVRRFNSLTVNAGSGGLGGYYEVASVGRIGRK